jgi:hypothetical protein
MIGTGGPGRQIVGTGAHTGVDIFVEQFLRAHRGMISALLEQGMVHVGGAYLSGLAPRPRRWLCDRYTVPIVQALSTGYVARPIVAAGVLHLTGKGVRATDLLTLAAWVQRALAAYIREELAADPDARDIVLNRLRQVYDSLVTKLTASLLDQQPAFSETRLLR